MRLPRRIPAYGRRRVWHWLADAGFPVAVWSLFTSSKWRPCEVCGWRGRGRYKHACEMGGGLERTRHYCSTEHYFVRNEW